MAQERAPYRWTVYSAAFINFMSKLDGLIVNISLPSIARDLKVGTGEASWVAMAYLLGMAATLPLFGKMADRLGAKRVFVWGLATFVAGSLLCGSSHHIWFLIGARLVQALGASMGASASMAIIARNLPQDQQGWAFGIQTTAAAIGLGIGAPLGGLITGLLSWHWIFLVNVPVGLAAILVAQRSIPADQEGVGHPRGRFDIPGAALTLLATFGLLLSLDMGEKWGWTSLPILLSLAISATAFAAFIAWEKRAADPLVDLDLFKNRDIALGTTACVLACVFMGGNGFIHPYYLQWSRGLSTEASGMVVWIYSAVYVLVASRFGRLADRLDAPRLCAVGCGAGALVTMGFAGMLGLPGTWAACAFMALLALAMAAFNSPNAKWVMRSAPEDSKGVVSGLYTTAFTFGASLGVGLFESIFCGAVPDAMSPGGPARTPASVPRLDHGFELVYWAGGLVLCAAALMAAAGAIFGKNRAEESPPGRTGAEFADGLPA